MARYLGELGADANLARRDGVTALLLAAQQSHLEMCRYLVKELGADVNQRVEPSGATPLHIAAQQGNMAVILCLVTELGANISQQKKDGSTPLHTAAQAGHLVGPLEDTQGRLQAAREGAQGLSHASVLPSRT